jgi:hypothetical protein
VSLNKRSLKAVWKHYREELKAPGEHLEIRVLDTYHRGLLPTDEEDSVRRHIVLCPECRDLLLELVSFLEDDGREGRVWSAEVAAAWEDWQDELARREAATVPESEDVIA